MSYILDALKRAEQERQIGQIPNAAVAQHYDEYDDEPRRWPWILLAIVLVAAVGAALGIWLSQSGTNNHLAATPQATQPTPQAIQPQAIKPINAHTNTRRPTAFQDTDMPTRVIAVTAHPQVINTHPEPSSAAKQTDTTATTASEEQAEPPEITAIEAIALAEPVKPAPPVKKSTPKPAPSKPRAKALEDLPRLKEMDISFRRSIPSLTIQFHRYSDDAARSFVLIDGARYRGGETLSAGPILEHIVEGGLVLRWQGQRFIYPVGG